VTEMLGKFANMRAMANRMGSMMKLSGGAPEDQEAIMKDLLETTQAKIAAGKVGGPLGGRLAEGTTCVAKPPCRTIDEGGGLQSCVAAATSRLRNVQGCAQQCSMRRRLA
jgi:hypothetical protein